MWPLDQSTVAVTVAPASREGTSPSSSTRQRASRTAPSPCRPEPVRRASDPSGRSAARSRVCRPGPPDQRVGQRYLHGGPVVRHQTHGAPENRSREDFERGVGREGVAGKRQQSRTEGGPGTLRPPGRHRDAGETHAVGRERLLDHLVIPRADSARGDDDVRTCSEVFEVCTKPVHRIRHGDTGDEFGAAVLDRGGQECRVRIVDRTVSQGSGGVDDLGAGRHHGDTDSTMHENLPHTGRGQQSDPRRCQDRTRTEEPLGRHEVLAGPPHVRTERAGTTKRHLQPVVPSVLHRHHRIGPDRKGCAGHDARHRSRAQLFRYRVSCGYQVGHGEPNQRVRSGSGQVSGMHRISVDCGVVERRERDRRGHFLGQDESRGRRQRCQHCRRTRDQAGDDPSVLLHRPQARCRRHHGEGAPTTTADTRAVSTPVAPNFAAPPGEPMMSKKSTLVEMYADH
ncbi:hypothetical protein QE397_003213 [Rhodococcus sp. SORGH_AS 301]|nr:hypothetical protein [Rhodococcus sp. SORGH_AS_0301]